MNVPCKSPYVRQLREIDDCLSWRDIIQCPASATVANPARYNPIWKNCAQFLGQQNVIIVSVAMWSWVYMITMPAITVSSVAKEFNAPFDGWFALRLNVWEFYTVHIFCWITVTSTGTMQPHLHVESHVLQSLSKSWSTHGRPMHFNTPELKAMELVKVVKALT